MSSERFKGPAFRFIIIFPAILALLSLVVMLLWNGVLTPVLEINPLNYWQAGGLLILCRILFGGRGGSKRGRPGGPPPGRQRFMHMTPEEKERIRAEWKVRCAQRKHP
jgi:Ca2+/H+ antiporter, TMEM165/GDT1 family